MGEVFRGDWWPSGDSLPPCVHGGHGHGGSDPYHLGGCKLQTIVTVLH